MGRAVTTIHKERGGGGYGDDNGIKQPATREHLMEELEGLWRGLDELFASMSPADWARKHGKHWTFEDIPYHLAYFDKGIATAIERGGAVPEGKRQLVRTMNNLHEWNTCQFAKRPPDQTVEESLRQMRQSRDEVRPRASTMGRAACCRASSSRHPSGKRGCASLTRSHEAVRSRLSPRLLKPLSLGPDGGAR